MPWMLVVEFAILAVALSLARIVAEAITRRRDGRQAPRPLWTRISGLAVFALVFLGAEWLLVTGLVAVVNQLR